MARNLEKNPYKIGGQGIVVELDESKFGKRKGGRGKKVKGAWVFGGVERTKARRMFAVVAPNRTEETLVALIQKYVAPGSIVYTDGWKSYHNINSKLGLEHRVINHSKAFVIPKTRIHTNSIEGTWSAMKSEIPSRCFSQPIIENYVAEFVWRRLHNENLWLDFLQCLK